MDWIDKLIDLIQQQPIKEVPCSSVSDKEFDENGIPHQVHRQYLDGLMYEEEETDGGTPSPHSQHWQEIQFEFTELAESPPTPVFPLASTSSKRRATLLIKGVEAKKLKILNEATPDEIMGFVLSLMEEERLMVTTWTWSYLRCALGIILHISDFDAWANGGDLAELFDSHMLLAEDIEVELSGADERQSTGKKEPSQGAVVHMPGDATKSTNAPRRQASFCRSLLNATVGALPQKHQGSGAGWQATLPCPDCSHWATPPSPQQQQSLLQPSQHRRHPRKELHSTIEDIYVANIETDRGTREKVRFYDICGLDQPLPNSPASRDQPQLPRQYFGLADGYILVYDTDRPESLDALIALKKDIDRNREKKELVLIVVGNRIKQSEVGNLENTASKAAHWAAREKIKHFEVNAMDRNTLFEPFVYLTSRLNPPPNKSTFPQLSMVRKSIGRPDTN